MTEILSFIATSIGFIVSFALGWFMASDKNRVELYKRKLDAYEEIFEHIQNLLILSIGLKVNVNDKNEVDKACAALAQKQLSSIFYISSGVYQLINGFKPYELNEPSDMFKAYGAIAQAAAKDLKLDNYKFLTDLSVMDISVLKKISLQSRKES